MAKILLTDPVAALSGRTASDDKIVFRTRNGRTHAYVIKHPNTMPHNEKQRAHTSRFGEIAQQVRAEMSDPTRRTFWENEFANYTKHHNPPHKRPLSSNDIPTYSSYRKPPITTLYGYIFHTLYEQTNNDQTNNDQTNNH